MSGNVRRIVAELRAIGLKEHAVAGVLGNLQQESGFDPTNTNGTHFGIAQWDNSRWARFKTLAREKGWGDINSVGAQAKYLAWEIKTGKGGTSVQRLNSSNSIVQAVDRFEAEFERSGKSAMENRRSYAQAFKGKPILNADAGDEDPRTMTWVPAVGRNVTKGFTGSGNYASGNHSGVDIGGGEGGQKIVWAPPVEGKVIGRGLAGGGGKNAQGAAYGNHVIIKDAKGRTWLLAHMASEPPKIGTVLQQGDKIGIVGATGNADGAHLHIEQTEPDVPYRSGGPVTSAKLVFKVRADGSTTTVNDAGRTPKGFFGIMGDYSASYLDAPGNEALREIYRKAKAKGWSQQKVTNEIYKSEWYKTRSANQRAFDKSGGADQQALLREKVAAVKRLAMQTGVVLSKDQVRFEAMRMARDGDTDDQARLWLANRYEYNPEKSSQGFVRQFQEDLDDMARQYGYKVGDKQREVWTREAIAGNLDADSYEDEMRASAQTRFPELNLQGRTLSDALSPWLDTAAQELGVQVSDIDLTQPRWTDLLNPDTGKMYTNDEWRKKVRTDSRYGWRNTQNGRREMTAAAGVLGQLFGAVNYG